MAKKRLTDVDKWKNSFFRQLPTEYKLFWIYLLDDCDHCGIWQVDPAIAEMRLGIKLSLEKARGLFGKRVVEFDGGTKWFIPDFIMFQYGEYSEKNKMSKSVMPTLKRYGLGWGINGGFILPKEKEEDKEKELGAEFVKSVASKVWEDQVWREQVCMGNYLKTEELKQWMAKFNASVMNDNIPDFNAGKYKKLFQGWFDMKRGKGVKLSEQQNSGTTLKPI